ncbi:MAG: hypothetical protein OIF57_12275 [Marinobacterium sp.]|nr:hypothetical protein [Marinobacterium sp.]
MQTRFNHETECPLSHFSTAARLRHQARQDQRRQALLAAYAERVAKLKNQRQQRVDQALPALLEKFGISCDARAA